MFVVMDIKAAGWQCSGAGAARRSEKKARSGEEDGAFWPASLVMHMHQPPATTDNDEQRGDSPQQNYRHCFLLRDPVLIQQVPKVSVAVPCASTLTIDLFWDFFANLFQSRLLGSGSV